MYVCPSFRVEQLWCHWTDFHEMWRYFIIFRKSICRKHSSFIKIRQEQWVLHVKTQVHVWSNCAEFCLECEIFQTNVVEKTITHVLYSVTFSRKFHLMWDIVEKYSRDRQATSENIARRMRFAWWITKAVNTYSEYVTFIAFPRQRWLRKHFLMLFVFCLSCYFPNIVKFVLKWSLSNKRVIVWKPKIRIFP